jgi:hypothetical protein
MPVAGRLQFGDFLLFSLHTLQTVETAHASSQGARRISRPGKAPTISVETIHCRLCRRFEALLCHENEC